MKIIETGFDGLILLKPKVYQDERGAFYESWRLEDYKKLGITEDFLQDNVSISRKNVLKGLHFQKNQGQLVTVTLGRIFDVVVDIRPESKTYKKYFSILLDVEDPQQLYMSPGFAHGFCVLSDMAIINYKCTQYYNPHEEGGIVWDDPALDIEWPIESPIISSRDQNFKTLDQIK